MHPVIRISIFLIFSYFLVQGHVSQLLLAGFVLSGIVIIQFKIQSNSIKSIGNMLWRLRWFFVSILFLYGMLSVDFGLDNHSQWLSSLLQGLLRVISLMLLVIAVVTMILSLPQAQLLAALIWIVQPLGYLGLPTRSFAVRMVLIMDAAEKLPTMVSHLSGVEPSQTTTRSSSSITSRIYFISGSIIQLFKNVSTIAEQTPCKAIHYQLIHSPKLYEWLYPLVCIVLFILVGFIE